MKRAKLEIYRDAKREWRWRLRASNGRIVADGGEGYRRKSSLLGGIECARVLLSGDVPLVCDSSSDFLYRKVPVERYGILYACAQKNAGPAGVTIVIIRDDLMDHAPANLPSMLTYKKFADAGSLLNTPPSFAVYMVKLITDWLLNDMGGLDKMYAANQEKAALLYEAVDQSGGFYKGHAEQKHRSLMNVAFTLPDDELTKKFLSEAEAVGLTALKGHRSVGGCRASIYNAMPRDGVVALCEFMGNFAKSNG